MFSQGRLNMATHRAGLDLGFFHHFSSLNLKQKGHKKCLLAYGIVNEANALFVSK